MKNIREILVEISVILILLLLSLGLLALPKAYFKKSDEALTGITFRGNYDISNEVKAMSMSQKLELFKIYKNDAVIINEIALPWDNNEILDFLDKSFKDYLKMISYPNDCIDTFIRNIHGGDYRSAAYRSAAYNIVEIENNEIYSLRLAVLEIVSFEHPGNYSFNISLILDLDTCEILSLEISMPNISVYSQSDIDFLRYLYDEKELAYALGQYYNTEIPIADDFNDAVRIDYNYIRVVPWDSFYYGQESEMLNRFIRDLDNKGYMILQK